MCYLLQLTLSHFVVFLLPLNMKNQICWVKKTKKVNRNKLPPPSNPFLILQPPLKPQLNQQPFLCCFHQLSHFRFFDQLVDKDYLQQLASTAYSYGNFWGMWWRWKRSGGAVSWYWWLFQVVLKLAGARWPFWWFRNGGGSGYGGGGQRDGGGMVSNSLICLEILEFINCIFSRFFLYLLTSDSHISNQQCCY